MLWVKYLSSSLIYEYMTWNIKYLQLPVAGGTESCEITKYLRNRILQNVFIQEHCTLDSIKMYHVGLVEKDLISVSLTISHSHTIMIIVTFW
jgi:hypothetical protein